MPLAAPAASSVQDKVTDDAGALSASEKSELEEKISQLQKDQHLVVYVVFADSLPGGAESYASSIVQAKGPNSAAYVVGVEESTMGVQTGTQWPQGRLDAMYDAAYGPLADGKQYGASALALVDVASSDSSGGAGTSGGSDSSGGAASSSGSGSGDGALWLAGGVGAVALAGGGIAAASRRKTKKDSAATLDLSLIHI